MKKIAGLSFLTLLLLIGLWTLLPGQVTNPITRALLKGGSREVLVGPTGSIDGYSASTLSNALAYAISQATAANPYTVRLLPGVYSLSAVVDFNGANGVNMIGAGRGATVLVASGALLSALDAGTASPAPLSLVGCTKCLVSNLTIDGVANALVSHVDGSWSGNAVDISQAGDVALVGVEVRGATIGLLSVSQDNPGSLKIYDSLITAKNHGADFFSNLSVLILGSDIKTVRDTQNFDTTYAGNTYGIYVPIAAAPHDVSIIGSSIYVEDQKTATQSGSHWVASIAIFSQDANSLVNVVGSTLRAKLTTGGDFVNFDDLLAGCVLDNDTGLNGHFQIVGTNIVVEPPASLTIGFVGGVVYSTANGATELNISGSNYVQLNGDTAGNFFNAAIAQHATGAAIPKIRIAGSRFETGPVGSGAMGGITGQTWGQASGSSTLAAGTKIIALVTNAGNQGAATKTFTGGGTSVTGGTTFLTQFKAGEYVRANGHADNCWTQIDSLTNTTLTLKEGYRCANATAIPQKGTLNSQTQLDASYRVSILPTGAPGAGAETLYVTGKHASGFTVTSTNGASTLTFDWVIIR